jgi:4-hydroxyphenylpyruvate dioxygenase-like putative hemolysin
MNLHEAIRQLNPNIVTIRGDVAYDKDDNVVTYDATAVQQLISSNQYKESRTTAYPSLTDQLDMLWHAIDSGTLDKTSEFYTSISAVKAKYPKGQ